MMTIKDRIRLNKYEHLDLVKSYFNDVFRGLLTGYFDPEDTVYLISLLEKYKNELKEEAYYLRYLLKHIDIIREDELNRVLELIDDHNRTTYGYYESMGDKYLSKRYIERPVKFNENICVDFAKNFKLTDDIKGVALTMNDIDVYFDNNVIYRNLKSHSEVVDNGIDPSNYGTYPQICDDKISGVKIIVPPVYNLKTALINVHQYKYGLDVMDDYNEDLRYGYYYEERANREEEKFLDYVRNK